MSFGSLPSVLGNGGGVAISVIGGRGLFADGTAAAPSISFASDTNTGFYSNAADSIGISVNGARQFRFEATGRFYGGTVNNFLGLDSSGAVSIGAAGTNQNITLTPSGTGQTLVTGLGVTGSAGAQASGQWMEFATVGTTYALLRAYNRTGSAGMNLVLNDAGGNVQIGTTVNSGALLQVGANGATGYALAGMSFGGDTVLYRTAAGRLNLDSTSDAYLTISKNGSLYGHWVTDATNVYFGSTVGIPLLLRTNNTTALTLDSSQNATFAASVTVGAGNTLKWNGYSQIAGSVNGVIALYNNAGTDFSRLQFGGTTSSFPALKRSGANLIVRAADDSADAAILAFCHVSTGVAITANPGAVSYGGTTATTVGAAGGASLLPATPLGYIIVNVAGTSAKIPYYNA